MLEVKARARCAGAFSVVVFTYADNPWFCFDMLDLTFRLFVFAIRNSLRAFGGPHHSLPR